MLEIIILYFLTRNIGHLAERKGLPPKRWKWITVGNWILFEFSGMIIGILLFSKGGTIPKDNLFGLVLFALACAFGGYLRVKYILEKKPDKNLDDDINRIGSNQLQP